MLPHLLATTGGGATSNITALDLTQFAGLYHRGIFDKIIILRDHCIGQGTLFNFQKLRISPDDILMVNRLSNNIDVTKFIEPYLSAKFLPYLEFHVADHCNLNCKACEHYSGLVKEPRFTNLKKFTRDFEQLHKFIDDIGMIRILGGEPLLNPDINSYVELSRRLYPKAFIRIVTNAILIPKMPDEFFDTLRRCNVGIDISFYPPLESKISSVVEFLKIKHIDYNLGTLKKTFRMTQSLKPHSHPQEIFLQCMDSQCPNLYDGKITVCPQAFAIKYFNVYYGKHFPESGALDLYDAELTTEKLKRHLLTPFELCRYCNWPPVDIEWRSVSNPSPLSDWVIDA